VLSSYRLSAPAWVERVVDYRLNPKEISTPPASMASKVTPVYPGAPSFFFAIA
jgi:hypothetical protein